MTLTAPSRPLALLTVRRAVTTEVLASLLSLLALAGMPPLWVDDGVDVRGWPLVVAVVVFGLVAGASARRTARKFQGPWGRAAATGQLTGDAGVDVSAVYVVERHASRLTSAAVMSSFLAVAFVVDTTARTGAPRWPLILTLSAALALWTLVLVTRPRARAKAIRTQYQRGWTRAPW